MFCVANPIQYSVKVLRIGEDGSVYWLVEDIIVAYFFQQSPEACSYVEMLDIPSNKQRLCTSRTWNSVSNGFIISTQSFSLHEYAEFWNWLCCVVNTGQSSCSHISFYLFCVVCLSFCCGFWLVNTVMSFMDFKQANSGWDTVRVKLLFFSSYKLCLTRSYLKWSEICLLAHVHQSACCRTSHISWRTARLLEQRKA